MAGQSTWTDERVTTLKTMWADGHSATQISAVLGSVTRSAVLGKVDRLELPARITVSYRVKNNTIKPARNPKPKIKIERKRAEDNTLPPIAVAAPEVFTTEHFVTLMDLENFHCRFPCWEDGVPFDQQFFCGSPTADLAESRPYCSFHSRIAFTAPSERKPQKYWRAA